MITTPISYLTKSEWRIWLPLAVFAFIGSSLLMSGWPQGLLPELETPFIYAGDGFAYLWNIQRQIEGSWYFENARSGFPFGSNHLDYPTADTGSYLILKILGFLFHTASATANLYFLLGFAICAAVTYLVTRSVGVNRNFAMASALLYSFTSFHFGRIGHLFFTWYFVAPLFLYIGFRLISHELFFTDSARTLRAKFIQMLGLFCLASFGIYYDLFGCIVLALCTLIAFAMHRSWRVLCEGFLTLGFVVLGLVLNVMPSLVHIAQQGESREGINRYAAESELYALKITQLLLPRGDHRLDSFADFASRYNNHFPLITENASASLGAIGSFGFILLLGVILISPFISNKASKLTATGKSSLTTFQLQVLAAVMFGLVLMGTLGGGSSLFAMTISSSFRGWNRISIFIAFLAVLAIVLALQYLVQRYAAWNRIKYVGAATAFMLTLLGLYDQTARPCHTCLFANQALMTNDRSFFRTLEATLPKQAAIYQLPYMTYSDNGPVNGLGSYDQARGYLHTSDLRWSFGGVRGRTGDWFYRKLAVLPVEQQIIVIQSMGFSGIYLDRRGYLQNNLDERCQPLSKTKEDRIRNNCMTVYEIEQDISLALDGQAAQRSIQSQDKQLVFFPLAQYSPTTTEKIKLQNLANSYLAPLGFKLENGIPMLTEGGFEQPLDFRKPNLDFPAYVGGVTGLSGISIINGVKIGRWSDEHAAKLVTVWLAKPLPQAFVLHVRAQAAGLNAGKPVKVKIGKQVKEMTFGPDFETKSVMIQTTEPVYKIEFIPADPFSPARRWQEADNRMIAIQFEQIAITPQ